MAKMSECHIDFEWYSDVDIKLGPNAYFGAGRNGPLCASYAFGSTGSIRRWLPHQGCPIEIEIHAKNGGVFVAHNAANFERLAWSKVLAPRYGWPPLALSQWRDTMSAALAQGLPAALEDLGAALNLSAKKDKTGKELIKFFCVPQKDGSFHLPLAHPAIFAQLQDYCDQDVRTEMAADARLIPLSAAEQRVWEMDCVINDRGVRVDRPSAIAAIGLIDKAKDLAARRIHALTDGRIPSFSAVARLTEWVQEQGVPIDGLAKDDILEALKLDDLPPDVEKVLKLRQAAAKTSLAKIPKFLSFSATNGRICNVTRFHGTGPGRWSSSGPQLMNLPRPRKIYMDAIEEGSLDPNELFTEIRRGDPEWLELLYGPELGSPLELVSDALRGFLIAAPGHSLIAVDYSGIQGALAAWYAGEDWKLAAMRQIIEDPKNNPDMYRQAAARILGLEPGAVTKTHRQAVGKTSELSLQFQGGVSALSSMARNYGMRRSQLHALYPNVWGLAPESTREKALKRHGAVLRSRNKQEADILTKEAWLACYCIVQGWRRSNPAIVAAWGELERAVRSAVRDPGEVVTTLKGVKYVARQGSLWCMLPSGRTIGYPSPRLKDQVWARVRLGDGSMAEAEVMDGDEARAMVRDGMARIEGETSPKVTVLGWDVNKRKMMRYGLYGGLIMENLALGAEACVLRKGMRECEDNGYPIVMHCYDEAVAEVPNGRGSVEKMIELMLRLPSWTEGLPLTAHGSRFKRYCKD